MLRKKRKPPVKVGEQKSEIVRKLPKACSDEPSAVAFMEEQRWGAAPTCARCGATNVYQMTSAVDGTRNARFLWRCHACKKQYTVRVGTIMEDSPIPVRHWCYAFWAACSSKKGVSAKQIQRVTGLSYKSALFLMHRIRWAMAPANAMEPPLSGDVEADETYMGGRPRKPNNPLGTPGRRYNRYGPNRVELRKKGPAPDFVDRKTPVFAAVERGGRVKARVVTDVTPRNLGKVVAEMIDASARLYTDEAPVYERLGKSFASHRTVNHSAGQYSDGHGAHTNTIEGFFALLKRGVTGTFHSVSRKHLHRYVSEFEFRYNARKMEDGERTQRAIQAAVGKRLTGPEQRA